MEKSGARIPGNQKGPHTWPDDLAPYADHLLLPFLLKGERPLEQGRCSGLGLPLAVPRLHRLGIPPPTTASAQAPWARCGALAYHKTAPNTMDCTALPRAFRFSHIGDNFRHSCESRSPVCRVVDSRFRENDRVNP